MAFDHCINLEEVNFGLNSVLNKIGECAFSGCKFSKFYIPKSVQYIGAWAFLQATKLTIYCEIDENNTPSGWDEEWYYDFGDSTISIVWDYNRN